MAQQTKRSAKNSSGGSKKRSGSSRNGASRKRSTTTRKRSTPTKRQGPIAEAAESAKDGAASAGSTAVDVVKKAKVPVIATGAGLAGLAGGAMLTARGRRKRILGVPMPRKSTTRNIANASKNVATFGEGMGSLASEMHRITTGLSDANAAHRSPIEVVLDGLTKRRR